MAECHLCCSQEGRRKGDPAVGRYIADTLTAVPRFSKAEFERLFSESTQDVRMSSWSRTFHTCCEQHSGAG